MAEETIDERLAEPPPPPDDAVPMPMRVNQWRRTSVVGAMLAGSMFGLQEALTQKERPEIVLEVDHAGEDDDEPISLFLDPVDPSQSQAVIREHLR